jgi:hypothetical protein
LLCHLILEGEKLSKRWKVGESFTTDYGIELTLGPDIDLESAVVTLSNGKRLTDELIQELAGCDCLASRSIAEKKLGK